MSVYQYLGSHLALYETTGFWYIVTRTDDADVMLELYRITDPDVVLRHKWENIGPMKAHIDSLTCSYKDDTDWFLHDEIECLISYIYSASR